MMNFWHPAAAATTMDEALDGDEVGEREHDADDREI
jgi:hypothetical protein